MYGKKYEFFGIKGYTMPKQPDQNTMKGSGNISFRKTHSKKEQSYMNMVIAHAKEVPDPRKYQKLP